MEVLREAQRDSPSQLAAVKCGFVAAHRMQAGSAPLRPTSAELSRTAALLLASLQRLPPHDAAVAVRAASAVLDDQAAPVVASLLNSRLDASLAARRDAQSAAEELPAPASSLQQETLQAAAAAQEPKLKPPSPQRLVGTEESDWGSEEEADPFQGETLQVGVSALAAAQAAFAQASRSDAATEDFRRETAARRAEYSAAGHDSGATRGRYFRKE
jgi:hypothetical protein